MSPTKDRQRAAARARLEREMATRAEAARRRRRLQAVIGAGVAALVVIVGGVLLVTNLGDDKADPSATSSTPAGCVWNPYPDPSAVAAQPSAAPTPPVKDVGPPPASGEPRTGTRTLTVSTNLGDIKIKMDLAKSPCIAASFAHLASKNFYNDTKCHRAFEGMLQCGDPLAKGPGWRDTDGQGGPTYKFADENLPTGMRPAYPRGTMAMANSGPGTNGSQFFFISKDTELDGANYAVVGTITEGLDLLDAVNKEGNDGTEGVGHPKKEVVITSVSVS